MTKITLLTIKTFLCGGYVAQSQTQKSFACNEHHEPYVPSKLYIINIVDMKTKPLFCEGCAKPVLLMNPKLLVTSLKFNATIQIFSRSKEVA